MGQRLRRAWNWVGCSRWRRAALGAALVLGLFVAFLCSYNVFAWWRLCREIRDTPRDPVTGIVRGAEALDLGKGRLGVLLLHGYLGSPRDFGELPRALARAGLRVRAPLHPGHGRTPVDCEDVSADELYRSVEHAYARTRAECDRVAVLGFSMGGALAVRLVRDTADPPEAVVLAAPYFRVAYRWYAVLPAETWTRLLSPWVRYVFRSRGFVQVNRREAVPDIYSYDVVPTSSARMLQGLGSDVRRRPPPRMPRHTFVVYSTGDCAASPTAVKAMADRWAIPAGNRLVLSRSNHIVFHDYDRDTVIEAVVRFVKTALTDT